MPAEPFGWNEALIASLTPTQPREHSPWFGCGCDVCAQTRADVARYGFDAEGRIAYPMTEPAFPWEQARRMAA